MQGYPHQHPGYPQQYAAPPGHPGAYNVSVRAPRRACGRSRAWRPRGHARPRRRISHAAAGLAGGGGARRGRGARAADAIRHAAASAAAAAAAAAADAAEPRAKAAWVVRCATAAPPVQFCVAHASSPRAHALCAGTVAARARLGATPMLTCAAVALQPTQTCRPWSRPTCQLFGTRWRSSRASWTRASSH
jgi:hypothetical protein